MTLEWVKLINKSDIKSNEKLYIGLHKNLKLLLIESHLI